MSNERIKNHIKLMDLLNENNQYPNLLEYLFRDGYDSKMLGPLSLEVASVNSMLVYYEETYLYGKIESLMNAVRNQESETWNEDMFSLMYYVKEAASKNPETTVADWASKFELCEMVCAVLKKRVTLTWPDNKWTSLKEADDLDRYLKAFGLTRKDIER